MFFLDELQNLKIYRKKFLLPIDDKDKRHHSVAMLMTPSYDSSVKMMNHELFQNKYFNSYYTERAALYYIDGSNVVSEASIITETIDDIIKPDKFVVYNGYENDILKVQTVINSRSLMELSRLYKVKLKYPVKVEIVRKPTTPASRDNTIYVCNETYYNKNLKNYSAYLYYCLYTFIYDNMNVRLPDQFKYALGLYDSGLYEIHKSKWIFDNKLKPLTDSVYFFDRRYGRDKRIDKLYKNCIDVFYKDTLKDHIASDMIKIGKMFGIDESYEDDNYYGEIINEDGLLQIGEDCLLLFNEATSTQNQIIRKLIYQDRIKSLKELQSIYEKVKSDNSWIKYTYNNIDLYKGLNLFVDFSRYNDSFLRNNTFKKAKGYSVYFDLMQRLICDKRFDKDYPIKTVIIPITDWDSIDNEERMWMIQDDINPISCIFNSLTKDPNSMKKIFPNTNFLFIGEKGYFKINFDDFDFKKNVNMFIRNIKLLRDKSYSPEEDNTERETSAKVITTNIVDKIEKTQGVKIDDISKATKTKPTEDDSPKDNNKKVKTEKELKAEEEKKDKDELVEKIGKSAQQNQTEDDVLDDLDNDERLKQILADLSEDPDEKSNISSARASRMLKLQNDLMDKEFKGRPLREILNTDEDPMEKDLTVTSLDIDSPNEEWKHLTYINSFDDYKPDDDIVKIFNSFNSMTHPLVVRELKAEDNSTSEDVIDLYTVQYEDANGKRFTIKVDIPRFIDNKYLKLRGNRKDISSQLVLMPIIKTKEDTVQIVSNYRKIFIRKFGNTTGKSNNCCDRLIKAITRNEIKGLSYVEGYNTRICSRYELPIDYVDMAGVFNTISTKTYDFYFNQDILRDKFKDQIDLTKGIPIGYDKKNNTVLYYNSNATVGGDDDTSITFAYYLALMISTDVNDDNFWNYYNNAPVSVRYSYSKASIMSTDIPLVVVCAYSEGLVKVMKKANIKYRLADNRRNMDKNTEESIKFKDGYIIYKMDYASSLLMNGLKACNTDDYSISEINSKNMYLDFLDQFGGRIKADGLDNFYNLMIDKPITYNSLKYYKLPTDYISVLLYANRLLADNKFHKHTYITDNRRIRRNEQIPAILYSVLAVAYGNYCTPMKHGRNVPMSLKQSAVIDEVLKNSTTTDKTILNALNEYEAYVTVTPKGPSGMNSDRSYTLDKRSYDESMLGVLGMSTGFAGNVGIARQATIDSNISTARGYITNKNVDNTKISTTKSLCMTEALTPFGTTRDDPFRSAMTYIQTSKHYMRCKRSNPSLITTGADEALPYMISNIFAKKADKNGKVVEVDDDRMLIEYSDGTKDYVDLEEHVEKNSSAGFYVTLKLDTDLKPGKTFKKGDVLAYDKSSFSSNVGATDNIAYDIGTIAKIAIMNTDEGYEDSAIISEDLCDDMASSVVLMCPNHPIILSKDTNVYNLVKKGQEVEEGDPLLIIQRPYDEEDANTLLKNLVDDPEEISNLGRIPIKSKVTGVVQDIVIYRTVEKSELSSSLKKIVDDYEKDISKKKKEMKEYGIKNPDYIAGSTDKLPAVGKLKNASDGVAIEIYIKYEDKMKVGVA